MHFFSEGILTFRTWAVWARDMKIGIIMWTVFFAFFAGSFGAATLAIKGLICTPCPIAFPTKCASLHLQSANFRSLPDSIFLGVSLRVEISLLVSSGRCYSRTMHGWCPGSAYVAYKYVSYLVSLAVFTSDIDPYSQTATEGIMLS